MLKNMLFRTLNVSGFYARKGTDALIGNGKDAKGLLKEMSAAYKAGTRGIRMVKEDARVTTDREADAVQDFILRYCTKK